MRKVVTFDDFSSGEYGLLGAAKAPKNSFTGTNVVRYIDGSIGPRIGLTALAVAGLPNGTVLSIGATAVSGRSHWALIGNTVVSFDGEGASSTADTYAGTTAVTATRPIARVDDFGNLSYITIPGDKCYKLDHQAKTVTALVGSPGGWAIAIYGSRLMVGASASPFNRLSFSEPADFTSWPSNFVDVGDSWAITGLFSQRQVLAITKQNGEWWVLSGTPGVNDVLRRVANSGAPLAPNHASLLPDGTVAFVESFTDFPSSFNGASAQSAEWLRFCGGNIDSSGVGIPPAFTVSPVFRPSDALAVSGLTAAGAANRALLRRNNAWTYHTFDSGATVRGFTTRSTLGRVVTCNGGGASSAATFYGWWASGKDRPALAVASGGSILESIGDASSTPFPASFTLPEYSSHDLSEFKVVDVAVDFIKYAHGYDANNAFTVTVSPLRRDVDASTAGGTGTSKTLTPAFSEAATAASTAGTQDRRRWSCDPQFAAGFQIGVSGIVGCAIQRVHVMYDVRPVQGA